ncbi:hypothetical protein [Achromobacter denitrificans]|uniref:hypothetical protein n=1 Tax=Achromobacter denitrificans TaxID=32002 RepID=UPI0029A844C4|nr:hypothetical protein [Achromobacter sp.]
MLNIPAGWKLVPERATQAMEDAWDATPANEDINAEFHAAYAAMLDAAPSPASVAPGDAQDEPIGTLSRNADETIRFTPARDFHVKDGMPVFSTPAAGDALADPTLQKLFGEAITGALAFGAQGVNQPPVGHWLEPFWKMARADAALAARLALLDHPLLRDVLGYVEDAGPADVWGAAQSWMALRDAALAAQVPQQGEA